MVKRAKRTHYFIILNGLRSMGSRGLINRCFNKAGEMDWTSENADYFVYDQTDEVITADYPEWLYRKDVDGMFRFKNHISEIIIDNRNVI